MLTVFTLVIAVGFRVWCRLRRLRRAFGGPPFELFDPFPAFSSLKEPDVTLWELLASCLATPGYMQRTYRLPAWALSRRCRTIACAGCVSARRDVHRVVEEGQASPSRGVDRDEGRCHPRYLVRQSKEGCQITGCRVALQTLTSGFICLTGVLLISI